MIEHLLFGVDAHNDLVVLGVYVFEQGRSRDAGLLNRLEVAHRLVSLRLFVFPSCATDLVCQ